LQTRRWRKADSNSRSHFSAGATLSLFATSRFEWDLCATYRSEPILLPIPPECARRVVVVTVLRGPHRGLAGYAITGFFELDEAALVECALTSCPVLKGLPTFGAPHRRAAHDPFRTIAGAGTQEFIVCPRSLLA
jgi:hypothetical protein